MLCPQLCHAWIFGSGAKKTHDSSSLRQNIRRSHGCPVRVILTDTRKKMGACFMSVRLKKSKTPEKAGRCALVIGAHFDDCECGSAAGLSVKLARAGWRVVFLNTIGNHLEWSFVGSKEREKQLLKESHDAARVIGAEKIFLPWKHNFFMPEDRAAVVAVAKVVKDCNPELALIPWPHDNHYDHGRTARAAMEALSYINRFGGGEPVQVNLKEILAYEISSWQTRDFTPDFYVGIDDEIDTVVKSIKAFKMLGKTADFYAEEKMTRCRCWGVGSGFKHAEGLKHLGPQFPVKSILADILGGALVPAGSLQYPWGIKYF
jgi:LmbE family N-acetylglucosaminyl deacetylase